MFSPNTWAKIETQIFESRKKARSNRILEIVLTGLLIPITIAVLTLLLNELIK